jgi:hypothetical protein
MIRSSRSSLSLDGGDSRRRRRRGRSKRGASRAELSGLATRALSLIIGRRRHRHKTPPRPGAFASARRGRVPSPVRRRRDGDLGAVASLPEIGRGDEGAWDDPPSPPLPHSPFPRAPSSLPRGWLLPHLLFSPLYCPPIAPSTSVPPDHRPHPALPQCKVIAGGPARPGPAWSSKKYRAIDCGWRPPLSLTLALSLSLSLSRSRSLSLSLSRSVSPPVLPPSLSVFCLPPPLSPSPPYGASRPALPLHRPPIAARRPQGPAGSLRDPSGNASLIHQSGPRS